jgi:hypothetical protein
MTEQPKKFDLGAIFDDLKTDTAREIIVALLEGDMHLWMNIAEDFPHAPSALIRLIQKAEAKFLRTMKTPDEEEKTLFTFGGLQPSARVVEIALFIANDPESLKTFKELTAPVIEQREKSIVEFMTAQTRAEQKKALKD